MHWRLEVPLEDGFHLPAAQFLQVAVPAAAVFKPGPLASLYLPVGQPRQNFERPPYCAPYRPAGQFRLIFWQFFLLKLALYVPAEQCLHPAVEAAPVVVLYLPLGHLKQATCPLTCIHLPLGHGAHTFAAVWYLPAAHFPTKHAALASTEVLPRGQYLHWRELYPPA